MSAGVATSLLDRVMDILTRQHNASNLELARLRTQVNLLQSQIDFADPEHVRELEAKIDDFANQDMQTPSEDEWHEKLASLSSEQFLEWLKHMPRRVLEDINEQAWPEAAEKLGLEGFRKLEAFKPFNAYIMLWGHLWYEKLWGASDDAIGQQLSQFPPQFLAQMPAKFAWMLTQRGVGAGCQDLWQEHGVEWNYDLEAAAHEPEPPELVAEEQGLSWVPPEELEMENDQPLPQPEEGEVAEEAPPARRPKKPRPPVIRGKLARQIREHRAKKQAYQRAVAAKQPVDGWEHEVESTWLCCMGGSVWAMLGAC
jgi:hypothetical protein